MKIYEYDVVVCGAGISGAAAAKGASPGHIYDTTTYTYTVAPFDAAAMKVALEEMLAEAGVTLLYHAMLDTVTSDNGAIQALTCDTFLTEKVRHKLNKYRKLKGVSKLNLEN